MRGMAWMDPVVVLVLLAFSVAARADELISVDEAFKLSKSENVRFLYAESEADYEEAHIPGSVSAYAHDLNLLADLRKCNLPMCPDRASKYIGETLGISPKMQVIVYDKGALWGASGTWLFMLLYGHDNVKIMDGGLATWKSKGFPVEDGHGPELEPQKYPVKVRKELIATKEEVQKASKDRKNYLIFDSRHNFDEYTGTNLKIGMITFGEEIKAQRGGHVPGALFVPWTRFGANRDNEPNKSGLKPDAELREQLVALKRAGYSSDKTVITYCHSGFGRGSFEYLALRRAGHKKAKVYAGSWNEWSNTPSLPVAK